MATEYRIDFDEIKRTVPMDQVIAFLGITGLKAKGTRQWKGTCPFCKGLDCFVVSNDGGREKTGAFNCFNRLSPADTAIQAPISSTAPKITAAAQDGNTNSSANKTASNTKPTP